MVIRGTVLESRIRVRDGYPDVVMLRVLDMDAKDILEIETVEPCKDGVAYAALVKQRIIKGSGKNGPYAFVTFEEVRRLAKVEVS